MHKLSEKCHGRECDYVQIRKSGTNENFIYSPYTRIQTVWSLLYKINYVCKYCGVAHWLVLCSSLVGVT